MRIHDVKKIFTAFFIVGFLSGILYTNLFAKDYIASMGIFNEYFMSQYQMTEIDTGEYLWYILKIRMMPIILLSVVGCTQYKKIAASVCLLWTGFSSGLLLTTAVMKMSIKGIVLCITGIFPHFLCYIAAYIIILLYLYLYPDVRWNSSKTISVILFVLTGIILECYINPILMHFII